MTGMMETRQRKTQEGWIVEYSTGGLWLPVMEPRPRNGRKHPRVFTKEQADDMEKSLHERNDHT